MTIRPALMPALLLGAAMTAAASDADPGTGVILREPVAVPVPQAAPAQPAAAPLPPQVARILNAHRVPLDSLSVWVQETGASAPLVAHQAQVPRNPASTIKLLTSWAGLQQLGPDYRWRTEAILTGPVRDGVLEGDLYLRGYGDPYLVMERLWLFVRELRQRGLREVRGDLVIDNSFFITDRDDPGAFDGQRYRAYNVLPDALLVNFQTINFTFLPDPVSNRVEIVTEPRLANLEIQNRLQLAPGGCNSPQNAIRMTIAGEDARGRITFGGQVASNCAEQRINRASLLPAPAFFYGVFRALWEESGGTIGGTLRLGEAPAGRRPFHRFESPPLAELIRPVNKFSNNVMTEHLFLTMGAERYGAPATPDKARDAVRQLLAERRLAFPELVLDNGSGLSRDTRISAQSMARLLLAAQDGLFAPEFMASMSLAGIDGTMRRRFRQEPFRGRMHLKTGRLNASLGIAGYVNSPSGRRFVVVSLHDHPDATRGPGEEAQDALLRWVLQQ